MSYPEHPWTSKVSAAYDRWLDPRDDGPSPSECSHDVIHWEPELARTDVKDGCVMATRQAGTCRVCGCGVAKYLSEDGAQVEYEVDDAE